MCCGSFVSCHAFYINSIILEERRKMNKKILDAAVVGTFCIGLMGTANIGVKSPVPSIVQEAAAGEEKGDVTAGVCRILSEYSFTTESDEETEIAKKEVIRVAEPEQVHTEVPAEGNKEAAQTEVFEPAAETAAVPVNRWNISLTKEEIDLLAKIVWLESRGEPEVGQEAVVEVVLNRIASDKYPNTLYDVLSQKNPVQFSSWKSRESAAPTEKEYQSIQNVLNGNTNILRDDTLYFSTEPLTSRLDVRIGGHSFCY